MVALSGAPRGSIYFHFPGGKEDLAVAAAVLAAEEVTASVEAASRQSTDAAGFARTITAYVAQRLESSDFRKGRAVATMVLDERYGAGAGRAVGTHAAP